MLYTSVSIDTKKSLDFNHCDKIINVIEWNKNIQEVIKAT